MVLTLREKTYTIRLSHICDRWEVIKVNVRKLLAKMVEIAVSVEMLSNLIGTSKSTFYRKLTNKGEDFTVGEANAIARALALSADEFTAIFFA